MKYMIVIACGYDAVFDCVTFQDRKTFGIICMGVVFNETHDQLQHVLQT